MSSPGVALIASQQTALKASADLVTALGLKPGAKARVLTDIPTDAAAPYVLLGDGDVEVDESDECQAAVEIVSQIGAWLKPDPPDATRVRDVVAAIKAAIFCALSLNGFTVVEWTGWTVRYLTDPDGSSHAAISVRYLIDPA